MDAGPDATNPADEAAIDAAQQLEGQVETNRRTVRKQASDALDDVGAVLALTNAAINANPAAAIRPVARAVRMLLRIALDRYERTD